MTKERTVSAKRWRKGLGAMGGGEPWLQLLGQRVGSVRNDRTPLLTGFLASTPSCTPLAPGIHTPRLKALA